MVNLSELQAAAKVKADRVEEDLRIRFPEVNLDCDPQWLCGSEKYTWLPTVVRQNFGRLNSEDRASAAQYCRWLLLSAISRFSTESGRYRLSPSIKALYERQLERIWGQIESFAETYFDTANDEFLKDLAILTHRLIPVGAEFAEGGGGIPKRVMLAGGAGQLMHSLWFVAFRCGGLKPFFALHAHTLSLDDFDHDGWQATYHRLAELLELNPDMRGWISSSWFLDPELETVSPRLAHLRKVPVENGGMLMFVRYERDGTSGALTRSPTRRRLFAEGRYVPATYMRVWPREAVIEWSRRQGSIPIDQASSGQWQSGES